MKTVNKLFICLLCSLMLCSCTNTSHDSTTDDSPISIYVGLGNNQAYYESIKDLIKQKLNFDVEFVYSNAVDTSTSALLMFKNNDLPADIMITAAKTPNQYLEGSCVDLMTCSTIVDNFTYQKSKEITTENGAVYQIPFTSRLIGITYNKTLMAEMGYEVPHNFADMLKLKQQCDEDGIVFSVMALKATGHGFNYLFHLMGSQWISTLEGSQWFENYISGKIDSSALKQQAIYFKKWVDNGLFQNCHSSDWAASKEYFEKRALFFFDLTSGITSYEGTIIDQTGNEIGTVKDEFATIPWISEDGSNNCYTYYDNMYLSLNKNLENNNDKLSKCIDILELLTTKEAISIFTNIYYDGYVSTNDFEITADRTYYNDNDTINSGYLQPWYYNYFDINTIVATGEVINRYVEDGSTTFDEIFTTLDEYQTMYLNKKGNVLASFNRNLSTKETAILYGKAALLSYENADGCLVAYSDQNHPYKPFSLYGVVANTVYKGDFEENYIDTIIPSKASSVVAVKLTGNEIEQLLESGLNEEEYNYPYVLVGIDKLESTKEYKVLVSAKSIDDSIYANWQNEHRIVLNSSNEVATATIKNGFYKYFANNKVIDGVQ